MPGASTIAGFSLHTVHVSCREDHVGALLTQITGYFCSNLSEALRCPCHPPMTPLQRLVTATLCLDGHISAHRALRVETRCARRRPIGVRLVEPPTAASRGVPVRCTATPSIANYRKLLQTIAPVCRPSDDTRAQDAALSCGNISWVCTDVSAGVAGRSGASWFHRPSQWHPLDGTPHQG